MQTQNPVLWVKSASKSMNLKMVRLDASCCSCVTRKINHQLQIIIVVFWLKVVSQNCSYYFFFYNLLTSEHGAPWLLWCQNCMTSVACPAPCKKTPAQSAQALAPNLFAAYSSYFCEVVSQHNDSGKIRLFFFLPYSFKIPKCVF